MTSIFRLFDHFMKPLDELEVPTTPRGYALNGFARNDFSIGFDPADANTKVLEANFQYGNLVHVEHVPSRDENGNANGKLPDWVGIILVPRSWDEGTLHATAYSAEAIWAGRALPWLDKVHGTPRTQFLKILELANVAARNIVIQPGVVEDKEGEYPDDFRLMALDHVKKLINGAGMDWSVTGQIGPNGNLQLFANLYNRLGVDTDLELTSDNTRLGSPLMKEEGTPVNQLFAFSQANTRETRYQVEVRDEASIADYGPLQLNLTFQGKHDPASLESVAKNLVTDRSRPVRIFNRTALDIGDVFSKLAPGNTCTIKDHRIGFRPGGGFGVTARVRITSVTYNDILNECALNVVEVPNAI